MQTTIIAQDSTTDRNCDAQSIAVQDRLQSLERELSQLSRHLNRIDANTVQRHRLRNAVTIQFLIICLLTLFSAFFPAPVVNGWLYGTYIFLIVFVCCDQRPLWQLASWLFAIGVTCGWALSQLFDFLEGELPLVYWIAVLYFPFVLSVLRPILKSFNLTLTVPDDEAFNPSPFRIRDLLLSTTSIALFLAALKLTSANLPEQEQRIYQTQAAILFVFLLASVFLSAVWLRMTETRCNWPKKPAIHTMTILTTTGLVILMSRTMSVGELSELTWTGVDDNTYWESIAAQNSESPASVSVWATLVFSFAAVAAQLTTRWLIYSRKSKHA